MKEKKKEKKNGRANQCLYCLNSCLPGVCSGAEGGRKLLLFRFLFDFSSLIHFLLSPFGLRRPKNDVLAAAAFAHTFP